MQDELFQVTENACAIVLGLAVQRQSLDPAQSAIEMASSVGIHGAWEGLLVVGCATSIAREVASVMFDTPLGDVDHEQCQDALGELANIIGGNMKALLPDETTMSLPVLGEDPDELAEEAIEIARVHLECNGQPMTVALYQR